MKQIITLLLLLCAPLAQAQELLIAQAPTPRLEWSYQLTPSCPLPTPTADILSSSTFGGTYTRVAQLPITATTYTLPAANNLYYRVATACGNSNVVQHVAATPPPTGPTLDQRVTTVETGMAALRLVDQSLIGVNAAQDASIASMQLAVQNAMDRIVALEAVPPPSTSANVSAAIISADQVEIVGLNCASLRTSGSGLRRTVTCVH